MSNYNIKKELCAISLKMAYNSYIGLEQDTLLIRRCAYLFRQLEALESLHYDVNQQKITLSQKQKKQLQILFNTAKTYNMSKKVFIDTLHAIVGDETLFRCYVQLYK